MLHCRPAAARISAIALLAVTAHMPASAADMRIKASGRAAPVADWTGAYLGLNAGYGWGHADIAGTPGDPNSQLVNGAGQPNVPALATSIRGKGWLGGIQAGYNWHFTPRWVSGIEADFAWAGLKGDTSVAMTIIFGNQAATFAARQSIDWFGTVRVRLGYLATPDLLLYATGGLAYGKVNDSASIDLPPGQQNSVGNFGYAFSCGGIYGSPTCFAGSDSRVSAGWAIGAGGEQRITHNLTMKVEYLHVDLGDGSTRMNGSLAVGGFTPSFLNAKSHATIDLVRLGVNYRF